LRAAILTAIAALAEDPRGNSLADPTLYQFDDSSGPALRAGMRGLQLHDSAMGDLSNADASGSGAAAAELEAVSRVCDTPTARLQAAP